MPKRSRTKCLKTQSKWPKLYAHVHVHAYAHVHVHAYAHACARIKRNVIPDPYGVRYHPIGVVREPGSRRMTVRLQKEKRSVTGPPMGSGMSTPLGCSYVHRGTHRVSPMHTGAELRLKKKKNGGSQFWPKQVA